MKKLMLIITCFLLTNQSMLAGTRSEQQMRQAAIQVLNRAKARGASSGQLKERLATSKLRIYGYDDGGFAVVTSDDRFDSVIGYSASSYTDSIPCGLKWWIEAVDNNMKTLEAPTYKRARTRASSSGAGPLLTTIWGQDRPFNDNCTFTYGGHFYQCVTGCVATAMAQVMNYYKYPERGTGSYSYDIPYNDITYKKSFTITFSEDFSQSVYDWSNMLDDYTSYYYSNIQDSKTKAVAKLMKDCGVSVNMRYNDANTGSSSSIQDVESALKTYFYYDEATQYYDRYNYQKSEWLNLIYDALDNGRPIVYSGHESDLPFAPGHAFVLHGYDSSGKVFVNWGWDGRYDGLFDIDLLNPGNDNYSYQQSMVIAIPANNTLTPKLYTLTLTAIGSGSVYYEGWNGTQVRGGSQTFQIKEGSSPVLILSPDTGSKIKTVKVNNKDVSAAVVNNRYTLANVQYSSEIVVEFEKIPVTPSTPQCATPTINYNNGEISFSCSTEGVRFVSGITVADAKENHGAQILLTKIYTIRVYATKDGYTNSDEVTREIVIGNNDNPLIGDVDGNGVVNEADHVKLTDIIMKK